VKKSLAISYALLFCIISVTSYAQDNPHAKNKFFGTMPANIQCINGELNRIFAIAKAQQKIQSNISDQLNTSGTVMNATNKCNKLSSLTIMLSEYDDAIFSLSKRIDENNEPVFTGHIFHKDSADGYELKKNEDGSYEFVKINMDDILPTCTLQ
jgi:hypothetical protein